jgi:hypothetical protein
LTQRTTTSARAIATSLVIAAIALTLIAKGAELLRFETAEAAAMAILARETAARRAAVKSSGRSRSSTHGRRRRDWRAGRDGSRVS